MKKLLTAFVLSTALVTTGCMTVANVVQTTTTASPKQANTLADAINLDTLANRAVTAYVKASNPSRATLLELQKDAAAVHDALVRLEQANAAHQNLTFAAVNAAYSTFYNYASSQGVKVQ